MHDKHDIGSKCFGVYLGTVVQHMTHGQLKVHIQGIYPDEWFNKPSMLPTCRQITPQFAGSHDGNGTFSYPNIGSTVVCMFANGDQNLPLTFGSLLGGPNAFGQYEHIKANDEISSTKHLITAGKSHYQMHESGKISAIVVDPIRTEAHVHYGTAVDSPLSTDAVTLRPVCEKVDAKEVSSVYCKEILDNGGGNGAYGSISHYTHYFNPTSFLSTTVLSLEQKTILDKRDGKTNVDSAYHVDNLGYREFTQLCSDKSTSISNVTDLANQTNTNQTIALTSNVNNEILHNLDGNTSINTISSMTDAYNYSFYNNATKESILSTHNIKSKGNSGIAYNIGTSFGLSGENTLKLVEAYSEPNKGDVRAKNLKSTNHSSIIADGKTHIKIDTLSSSRLTESDLKIGLTMHNNKHNAQATIDQDTNSGIVIDATWKDDDIQVLNGTTIQLKQDNFSTFDIKTGKDPSIEKKSQKKFTKLVNGSQQQYDVICEDTLSPTSGKILVQITDNITKDSCTFQLDAKGNMKISATKSISIDAPVVNLTGTTMTQQFKNLTQTASTIMISGARGDCKIKNVSLLNHKHQETQSGDVVAPQPTKIATQSN